MMIERNKKRNKKGFTLIEMIISIFVFAIIMIAIVDVFARQINAHRYARSAEGDLENAQFALNYIAKTLRTASVLCYSVGDSTYTNLIEQMQQGEGNDNDFYYKVLKNGEGLIIYDFSQEACIRLSFREAYSGANAGEYAHPALWMETQSSVGVDEIEKCLDPNTWATNSDTYKNQRLTTGDVTGSFAVAPTRYMDELGSRQTDTMGRVTATLRVQPSEQQETHKMLDPVYIQTSVSLRDYPSDLSF